MRTVLTTTAILCTVAVATSADAQERRLRIGGRRPNARHEDMKRQSEEAYRDGEYDRAVKLTTSVLRENPRDHVALYLRASSRVELGTSSGRPATIREGISDAREAIRVGGTKNVDYYLPYLYGMTNLTSLEGKQEHAKIAIDISKSLLARTGLTGEQSANIAYQRGNAHIVLNDVNQGIKDFDEAIRSARTHLAAHLALADAYSQVGKTSEAQSTFDRTVKTFSNNPLVWNNRGMFHQSQKKHDAAIADFTRAIELDRQFFVAFTNRGFTLLDQGNAAAAEEDLTRSLQINNAQPFAYSFRAAARLAQFNLDAAIEDYKRVATLDPRSGAAQADLGFAHFYAEDYRSAATYFKRALELDPQMRYVAPWRFLAVAQTGESPNALAEIKTSLAKPADKRDWIDAVVANLATNLNDEELTARAAKSAEAYRVAQLCEAHFFIGQRQLAAGQTEQARVSFQKAIEHKLPHLSAYRGARIALKRSVAQP